MRRYGGAGSVVKPELVALALACQVACEVISWALDPDKAPLLFSFFLFYLIGIRRRLFAMLVLH
jgi:hypothetical protein